jgi:hypothetical protein
VTLWLVLVGWLNKPRLVDDADLTPAESGLLPRREAGLPVERTEQVLRTLSDYKVVVLGNARHGLTASFNGEWIARGLQYDHAG